MMASLIVRNVEQEIIDALKARAGQKGRSAEAEHRRILQAALLKPQKKSFYQVLKDIPEVGLDSDFERTREPREHDDDVFN